MKCLALAKIIKTNFSFLLIDTWFVIKFAVAGTKIMRSVTDMKNIFLLT